MIVTISRQFGSGGREVGKRLADEFNLAYYDRELITEIAKKTALNENYVASVLENGSMNQFSLFSVGGILSEQRQSSAAVYIICHGGAGYCGKNSAQNNSTEEDYAI